MQRRHLSAPRPRPPVQWHLSPPVACFKPDVDPFAAGSRIAGNNGCTPHCSRASLETVPPGVYRHQAADQPRDCYATVSRCFAKAFGSLKEFFAPGLSQGLSQGLLQDSTPRWQIGEIRLPGSRIAYLGTLEAEQPVTSWAISDQKVLRHRQSTSDQQLVRPGTLIPTALLQHDACGSDGGGG